MHPFCFISLNLPLSYDMGVKFSCDPTPLAVPHFQLSARQCCDAHERQDGFSVQGEIMRAAVGLLYPPSTAMAADHPLDPSTAAADAPVALGSDPDVEEDCRDAALELCLQLSMSASGRKVHARAQGIPDLP